MLAVSGLSLGSDFYSNPFRNFWNRGIRTSDESSTAGVEVSEKDKKKEEEDRCGRRAGAGEEEEEGERKKKKKKEETEDLMAVSLDLSLIDPSCWNVVYRRKTGKELGGGGEGVDAVPSDLEASGLQDLPAAEISGYKTAGQLVRSFRRGTRPGTSRGLFCQVPACLVLGRGGG